MPQGLKKNKVKLPGKLKEKQPKKILGLKKGNHDIAPKKSKLIEDNKIKKTITKIIHDKVEKDVASRVANVDSKSFVVKPGKLSKK